MNDSDAQTSSPSRSGSAGSALVVIDDQAVLRALRAAYLLHGGPVTVTELVWAWSADLWWDAVTDSIRGVDRMAIPHTPSHADLARVRRRLTALRRQGLVACIGNPPRWQPLRPPGVEAPAGGGPDRSVQRGESSRVVRGTGREKC